jgi:DNA-binding transcriptional LysR family regulator
VDIRDLVYFETIAQRHLGRAAELLGRTQPALTKCIRRLESEIGAKLFTRSGRGLQLTKVGEVLLARGSRLNFALNDALREVSDFAKGAAGRVRVGTGATMAEYLLPQVSRTFIQRMPGVTVEILIGMSDVLRAALRDGQIDVAVGPTLKGEEEEFAIRVFGMDEVVVVAPFGHPLCGRKVTMDDLARYRWVLPARSVEMRRWLDGVFKANGLLAGADRDKLHPAAAATHRGDFASELHIHSQPWLRSRGRASGAAGNRNDHDAPEPWCRVSQRWLSVAGRDEGHHASVRDRDLFAEIFPD